MAIETNSAEARPYVPLDLVTTAAAAHGYARTDLDPFSGLVARFTNGAHSFVLEDGIFPQNTHTAARLARDKAHANHVLSAAGFTVPAFEHVFVVPEWADQRPRGREISDAFRLADGLGYPLFAKPIDGSLGRNVARVETPDALAHQLTTIGRQTYGALLQRPATGTEHRFVVADGRVRFAYAKRPAAGRHTANRSAGMEVTDIMLEPGIPQAVKTWAAAVADAIGLAVAGVDAFVPQTLGDSPDGFQIIEVNANPGLRVMWEHGHEDLIGALWADAVAHCVKARNPDQPRQP